jgi:transposase
LTDAQGRLIQAFLSPGQASDMGWALATVGPHRPRQLLADRGYDSNPFRRWLRNRRIRPVIPGTRKRKRSIRHDRNAYRRRGRVENFFSRLKQWSALALRREKSDEGFFALVQLFSIKDTLRHAG